MSGPGGTWGFQTLDNLVRTKSADWDKSLGRRLNFGAPYQAEITDRWKSILSPPGTVIMWFLKCKIALSRLLLLRTSIPFSRVKRVKNAACCSEDDPIRSDTSTRAIRITAGLPLLSDNGSSLCWTDSRCFFWSKAPFQNM